MTNDTIHFAQDDPGWTQMASQVTAPVLSAQEARILLDHLNHVQAAQLLGDRWTVWCQAKGKLVAIEYDGTKA